MPTRKDKLSNGRTYPNPLQIAYRQQLSPDYLCPHARTLKNG